MFWYTSIGKTLAVFLRCGLASLVVTLILYLGVGLILREQRKKEAFSLHIARVVFFTYLLGIFLLGLFPNGSMLAHHNFAPFQSILSGLQEFDHEYRIVFSLNFLVFLPMGFLLPMAWPQARGFWKVLGLSLMVCLSRELIQLILNYGRVFDIDSLLICAATTALGYGGYALARSLKGRLHRKTSEVLRQKRAA